MHSKGWDNQVNCEDNCKFIKDDDKTCKIANDDERAVGGSGLFSRKRYCEKRWECVDNGGKQGDRQCVKQAGGQYEKRECESRCVALNENTYNPILEFTFVEDLSSLSEFDKNIFEKKLKELLSELLSEYSKYYHIYSKYIFLIEWDETNPNIINIKLLNHHAIRNRYKIIKDESEYIELIKKSIEILREQSIKLYISFNYYSIRKITLKFEFENEQPYCEWKEYGLPTEPILEYSGDYMFLEIENISNKLKTKVLIPNTVNKSATLISNTKKNDYLDKMEHSLKHNTEVFNMPSEAKLYEVEDDPYHYETPEDDYQQIEIFTLDEDDKASFEYRPYFEKDVIDDIFMNNIDIKMLQIGKKDPNHIFDMVEEIYIILFKTPDNTLKYRLLKLDLDLYTKFKYREEKIDISNSLNKLNIYAGIYKDIMDDYKKKIEYKHVLYDVYQDTLDFELKLNIFKNTKLADILIYNEDTSLAPNEIICNFTPSGNTLYECKQSCYNGIDNLSNLNLCQKSECESLCDNCMNLECKWNVTDYRSDLSLKPPTARIKAFSGNNTIKVTWIRPYTNTPITQYYILVESSTGQFFNIYVHKSESELNEYIIQNLQNDVIYKVAVICKNKFGVSEQSNIENIIPDTNNSFDKGVDTIDMSQYNDALENNYRDPNDKSKSLDTYDKYKKQIALFEREIVINDLKDIVVDKLVGKPNLNMYNLNIY